MENKEIVQCKIFNPLFPVLEVSHISDEDIEEIPNVGLVKISMAVNIFNQRLFESFIVRKKYELKKIAILTHS